MEISFEGKFLRKATKSQEIRRNSFTLLLHNTVVSSIKSLLCQMGMDPNSKYNKLIQERNSYPKTFKTVDLDTLKR